MSFPAERLAINLPSTAPPHERHSKAESRKPKLAIVGASARSAAFSALRAGLQPVAADLFADTDLQQVCPATRIAKYPDGFANWLEQTECDYWLYTGALENHPDLVDAMAACRPLLGNRGNVLREVRSPMRLAEVLREAELPFPETRVFSQSPGAQSPGVATPRLSYLIKTGRGSSGTGVWNLEDATPTAGNNYYLQQRIDGTACSAVYVGNGSESMLLGFTKQLVGVPWTHAAPLQYCGSITPHPLPSANLHQQIEKIGNVLSAEFGLVGLFGVDMILDGCKAWTIEVNPRYTAAVELIERAAGIQAIDWHIAAVWHDSPSRPTLFHGKIILFAKQMATITEAFTHWATELACQAAWPDAADIPATGTVISARQPIVTLFATGNSTADVEGNLRQRIADAERKL